MAPECTGNLLVLDLKMVGAEVECEVDRLDVTTAVECLHVSWNATSRPAGTDAMGPNVVFVWRPPGYYRRSYHSTPDRLHDAFSWVHPVQGELMLILALPAGYVIPSVDDARPTLVRCKKLEDQGRMAVYWMLNEASRCQVTWKMVPFSGELDTHLAALNDEASKRSPENDFGTIIDGVHVEKPCPEPTMFIIHGHDHAGVEQLRDVIKRLKLPDPIVMKEKLRPGATIVEKFEQLAEPAVFAIALLTPDDIGGAVGNRSVVASTPQYRRARQNAWLEIGWFWGRLGRDHLLLLVKGDIEIPSDLYGLEYIRYQENVAEESDRIIQFFDAHKAL